MAATSGVTSMDRWQERVLLAVFLLTAPLVNPYIRGDGNEYYAYVRSLVIDGDLQFDNEYLRGDPAFVAAMDGELRILPTGYRRNPAGVGAAILWTPFFLTAHTAALGARALGWPVAADGYAAPYRWLCAFGTACYAFVGLLLAYRMARRWASPAAAGVATLGIWFASSLPVYMYFVPFHVHALGAFTVALFLWWWLRVRETDTRAGWTVWGALGGCLVQTYLLNGVVLLVTGLELARRALRPRRRAELPETAWRAGLFAAGAAAALLPTFIVKAIIHGSPVASGYPDELFYWTDPRLLAVGFATEHGLFLWTPIVALAAAGLAVLWRRDAWTGGVLATVFAAFYYVVASYVNWHGHSAYGSRFLVALTPLFVIGLAVALDGVVRSAASVRFRLAAGVVAALVMWNVGLMFQWGTNLVPNRGPVDFARVARNQVLVVPQRMGGFLVRYLSDRHVVIREVERDDLSEADGFRLRR